MPARYVLKHGRSTIELPRGESFIGRSPECRLRLDQGLVSRRHARLFVDELGVVIEDLGSVNGTLLNGELLVAGRRMFPGDTIQIASVEIRVEVVTADEPLAETSPRPNDEGSGRRTPPPDREETTLVGDAPSRNSPRPSSGIFLTDLAEKALSLGKVDDARRLVGIIQDTLMREQSPVSSLIAHDFVELSLRMATQLEEWVAIDRIFEVAARLGWVLPQDVVDAIGRVATTLRPFRGPGFVAYLERWRGPSATDAALAAHLREVMTLVARRTLPGAHA